jgi:hypothetical protein
VKVKFQALLLDLNDDETLLIINKPKDAKKGGKTKNKMEGSMSKKTKENPKKVNHEGNIKFPNPLRSQEAYQIRKGVDLLKGHLI